MPRTAHRLIAGSAAVLTALAMTAMPASAAEAGPAVSLQFPDVAIAPGAEARSSALMGWLTAGSTSAEQGRVGTLRLTVETADVAGFATVVVEDDAGIGPDASCGT